MELFSWGANSHGQLGLGHSNDTWKPVKVDVTQLKGTSITSIVGGGGHTALLTDDGQLMLCGLNDQGQLGDSSEETRTTLTLRSLPTLKVANVSCGWDFTIVIVCSGQLWSWGSNTFGQIAQDISCKKSLRPMLIECLRENQFVDVSAGLRHAAAISSSGVVWTWGDSRRGQIPDCCRESASLRIFPPVKVNFSKPVEGVSCGSFFTLLMGSGELFGWGDNRRGQLAQDPKSTGQVVAKVTRLPAPRILAVDVGWNHVLAISDGGRVLSWGRGDYGQLGRSCPQSGWDSVPCNVDLPHPVTQVHCGSEHSFAVSEDGCLFAWGWNEHGMCALPENVPTLCEPHMVSFESSKKVVYVGVGAGHSYACLKSY